MTKLLDVQNFFSMTLCRESGEAFGCLIEDMFYRIRSWSMIDLNADMSDVEKRIDSLCMGIIKESIKVFLAKSYKNGWEVVNERILDEDKRPIPSIEEVKAKRSDIMSLMRADALREFEDGRALAIQIMERAKSYSEKEVLDERDYEVCPPREQYEREVMSLEAKLPKLSKKESRRLLQLYSILRGE